MTAGAFLEVSVTVDGEAAEAVCELFDRHGGGSVVEITVSTESSCSSGAPTAKVKTYLPENDVAARSRIEQGLWHLGQIYPIPEPDIRHLAQANWADEWKKHFTPQRIGRRFVVTPSWTSQPEPTDSLVLRLDPGMAFGTGLHPTTRLCLLALEDMIVPGESLLDVGTGSGILSIGGALLGATPVVACDTDPEAARIATANAMSNNVDVAVHAGSVEAVPPGRYDVVVANILAGVIMAAAGDLVARLAAGGRLIVSGILADQRSDVVAALDAEAARFVEAREDGDWVALCFAAP